MAIKNYLLDTNTVIYYLQGQFSSSANKFMDGVFKHHAPSISIITEIELLCWETNSKEDMHILNQFIKDAQVFELDNNIKIKTITIRRAYKIKLPDAIIAATALVHNLTLLTRNEKDFSKISNVESTNPWNK